MSARCIAPAWLFIALSAGACAHPVPAAPSGTALLGLPSATQLLEVADLSERLGDRLRAQQYLLAALRAGAERERVVPRLLRLYVGDGQYRLAIEAARDQLRSHPRQSALRLLLADLYTATQLDAAAMAQYERVLAIEPDQPRAHFALASLLHESGHEPGRADAHFRAYLALQPNGEHAEEARALLLEALP